MKKINGILALVFACALVGIFATCGELDTAARVIVKFVDPRYGNEIPDLYVEKGGTMGDDMPRLPESQGVVLYGWFDGQTQYDRDTIVSHDVTLTARWSDDVVTVTFAFTQTDSDGKVIEPTFSIPPVKAFRDLPLGPLKFPVTPRARGWEFVTWVLDGEDFTTDSPIPDDVTLTAFWVAKKLYTVEFNPGPGMQKFYLKVYADDCIDEWMPAGETQFPPKPQDGTNPVNGNAFFVAWLDKDENREYDGRTPITRNLTDESQIVGRWGLPPHVVDFKTEIVGIEPSIDSAYGNVNYAPAIREAWDSTPENPKWVIVNNTMYDFPYNTNRWRILYRIEFKWPDDFATGFYTRYTIRARFYANQQGVKGWKQKPGHEGDFAPSDISAAEEAGYSAKGWLKKEGYDDFGDDGKRKEVSRSNDGWGQVSWISEANWNGQGADEQTMLQRYNLDRKGGTINDTWSPQRNKDANPPYLLIQTSDAYIGHIEITEIVFHNGRVLDDPAEDEWQYTAYVDEEKPAKETEE